MNSNYYVNNEESEYNSNARQRTDQLYKELFDRSANNSAGSHLEPRIKFGFNTNRPENSHLTSNNELEELRQRVKHLENENNTLKTKRIDYISNSLEGSTETNSLMMLPSEFSRLFEETIKDDMMNWLANFSDLPFLTADLVQNLFLNICDLVNEKIQYKIENLGEFFGVRLTEKVEEDLKGMLRKYCTNLRGVSSKEMSKIKEKSGDLLRRTMESTLKRMDNTAFSQLQPRPLSSPADYYSELEECLSSPTFPSILSKLHELLIFMKLHRPELSVSLTPKERRVYFLEKYQKGLSVCVDGFASSNTDCLVLLPRVQTKDAKPFISMKYFVLPFSEKQLKIKIPNEKTVMIGSSFEIKETVDRSFVVEGSRTHEKKEESYNDFDFGRKYDDDIFPSDEDKIFKTDEMSNQGPNSRGLNRNSSENPSLLPTFLQFEGVKQILGENKNFLNTKNRDRNSFNENDIEFDDDEKFESNIHMRINYLGSSVIERTLPERRDTAIVAPKKSVKFAAKDNVIEFDGSRGLDSNRRAREESMNENMNYSNNERDSKIPETPKNGKYKLSEKGDKNQVLSMKLKAVDIQPIHEVKNLQKNSPKIVNPEVLNIVGLNRPQIRDERSSTPKESKGKARTEINLLSFDEWKVVKNAQGTIQKTLIRQPSMDISDKRERSSVNLRMRKVSEGLGKNSLVGIYEEMAKQREEVSFKNRLAGNRRKAENHIQNVSNCTREENNKLTKVLLKERPNSTLFDLRGDNSSQKLFSGRTNSYETQDLSSRLLGLKNRSNSFSKNKAPNKSWKTIKTELVSNLGPSSSGSLNRLNRGLGSSRHYGEEEAEARKEQGERGAEQVIEKEGIKSKKSIYSDLLSLKEKMGDTYRRLRSIKNSSAIGRLGNN